MSVIVDSLSEEDESGRERVLGSLVLEGRLIHTCWTLHCNRSNRRDS